MAAYVTSGCAQRRAPLGLMGLAAVVLLGLTACGKLGLGGSDEMSWARAALERNDRIEIVATDPATSTFTVRMKDTGELRTVRLEQIVAAPPGLAASAGGLAPAASGAADASQATSGESATASNTEPAPGQAASEAPAQNEAASSAPATATNNAASNNANNAMPAAASNSATSSSPGPSNAMMRQAQVNSSVPRTGYQPEQAPAAEIPNPNGDVASVTPGGRVLESGPGYAIKMASAKSTGPTTTARVERSSTTSAIERRHDPIICQGDRLLHIDNRNLEFDGDAVSAQDGCEIHITNSHIIAKGVGVSARRANVHIDNSQIEGDTASIDASEGAQVYAESSTFKGVSRRLDNSSFHDLGGNVWN